MKVLAVQLNAKSSICFKSVQKCFQDKVHCRDGKNKSIKILPSEK